ncbi:MAG: type IV toxin-antitoxin system AbiEi family antitoxin domain-containing protein [Nocardioides sp.]
MSDAFQDPSTVVLRREVLAQGYDDRAIRDLVRQGVWERIRRGAYADKRLWDSLDAVGRHRLRARAVLRAAHPSAALSHSSAVAEREGAMWGVDLDDVHITRTDGKAGRREAGVAHHCGELSESEVSLVNGLRVTSVSRSVVELSTLTDLESCLVTGNWFLGQGQTSLDELVATCERLRFWPGTLRKHLLTLLFDGRNMWPGEARTSYLLWRQHLPKPVPQYAVHAAGLLLGIVDFAWPDLGVFLEFDGRIKYDELRRPGESLEDVIRREKRREEQICTALGWVCLRITWDDLARPVATARRIRALLESRRPVAG